MNRPDEESSDEDILEGLESQPLYSTTEDVNQGRKSSRRAPYRRCLNKAPSPHLKIAKELVLFSLAFWGIFSIFEGIAIKHDFRVHQESRRGCDCGASIQEAIVRGCKFDSLAMAWLPEHCRDDELTAEFNKMGNGPNGTWVYYADTLHTVEIDPEVVAAMGDIPSARAHMNENWHTIHCIFYWRKQYRTKFNGKIVEPRSDSESHIKHCGMILQEPGYGTISGVALNTNKE